MGKYHLPYIEPGTTFGRLTVLERLPYPIRDCIAYKCQCSCENKTIVEVEGSRLLRGNVKSCGCRKHETMYTPEELVLMERLRMMIQRCHNPNNTTYSYYGGRGIYVCDEWRNDPRKFVDWSLTHGFAFNLTIDRIDPNGPYSPENCRWVDRSTQQNNRRCNHFITVNGERKTLAQWDQTIGERHGMLALFLKVPGRTEDDAIKYIQDRLPIADKLQCKRELLEFLQTPAFASIMPQCDLHHRYRRRETMTTRKKRG